jgi:hypothetical protein
LQLVAQAFTFLLAGYETTANALAFAIYCIATHPEAERKVRSTWASCPAAAGAEGARRGAVPMGDAPTSGLTVLAPAPARRHTTAPQLLAEVDALGASKAGGAAAPGGGLPPLEPGDLERLPFTRACLNEALRLYPPATAAAREAAEPLDLGGHQVPQVRWCAGWGRPAVLAVGLLPSGRWAQLAAAWLESRPPPLHRRCAGRQPGRVHLGDTQGPGLLARPPGLQASGPSAA